MKLNFCCVYIVEFLLCVNEAEFAVCIVITGGDSYCIYTQQKFSFMYLHTAKVNN